MNRGGFSWKRLLGISGVKSRISRQIGVPLTSSGRQRKLGRAMGCSTFILSGLVMMGVLLLSSLLVSSCSRPPAQSNSEKQQVQRVASGIRRTMPPVEINMGDRVAKDERQCYVGEPEAIRQLASSISSISQSADFTIRWTAVYPPCSHDASEGRYPHTIQYDRTSKRLVHDVGRGTTYTYSGVTPSLLNSLAAKSLHEFVTTDDLPSLGCKQE